MCVCVCVCVGSLIVPVYDASKRYERHWCGLDTSEVNRDFESRFRAIRDYM